MMRYKETKYLVTEDGKIWSEHTKRFLKPCNNAGYQNISLGGGPKCKRFIHRMVAEVYIPNPNNYDVVNHINNDKTDNRVENLEWCTQKMNIHHSINQGRTRKGSDHVNSKITEVDANEIRRLYSLGGISQQKLGDIYDLCQGTVWEIIHKRTWKDI